MADANLQVTIHGTGPSGVDGDKGDITVTADGMTWTIDNGAVTAAKVAADVATQAELDAHVNQVTDAHDASAVSVLDSGNNLAATNVETALAELADRDDQVFLDAGDFEILIGTPSLSSINQMVSSWMLDPIVSEGVGVSRRLPGWTTFSVAIYWAATTTAAGNAFFYVGRGSVAAGAVPSQATLLSANPAASGVANQIIVTAVSGTFATATVDLLRFLRWSDAADTYPDDMAFVGLMLTKVT